MTHLSKTGPVVVEIPPGQIYGVVNDAWMQPIKEIDGKPGKLLLVGPGQDIPRTSNAKSSSPTPFWRSISEFNERASYGFEATPTSAGMVSRVPGKGSAYLGSYYDADGNALMGGHNYTLHLEPSPPAANFWSITVYDIENRLIIRNDIKRSGRSSRTEGLIKNADGSVDLYFGPKAPEGKDGNWIQTNEGQSFFVYLRLYGPEQAYFDQTFLMNKIQKVE